MSIETNRVGKFADWSLTISDRVELCYARMRKAKRNFYTSAAVSLVQVGILCGLVLTEGDFQKAFSFYVIFLLEFAVTLLLFKVTRDKYREFRKAQKLKNYTVVGTFLE